MTVATGLGAATELVVLDHLLGVESWTMPTYAYMALSLVEKPTCATWEELPDALGYSRQPITFLHAVFDDTLGHGISRSNIPVVFGPASGVWGVVASFSIYDSAVIGEGLQLCYGKIDYPVRISSGGGLEFRQGGVSVQLVSATEA